MTRERRILTVLLSCAMAAVVVITGSATPAYAAKKPTSVTMYVDLTPRYGEAVYFNGYVKSNGKAQSGRQVDLLYRKTGTGNNFQVYGSTRSSSTGKWVIKYRPVGLYDFKVVVRSNSTHNYKYSPLQRMTWSYGPRTLESRVAKMGDWAGNRYTDPKTTNVSGAGKVRYQNRHNALFVEATRPAGLRTYVVQGEIRKSYIYRDHVKGKVGLPLGDAICGKLEDGCKQRFTNGVIYDNKNIVPTTVTGGHMGYHQVLAAARSQVGYSAPSNNISKYNKWIGTNNAWCSIFLSWAAAASGNSDAIRSFGNFRDFHSWAYNNLPRGKTPKVGAIAFFDTHTYDGRTAATHAGLVTKVSGSRIHTIEGNTSNPSTGSGRGVYNKNRSASHPLYYVYPKYGHGA